jgi:hypothetical protein
VTIDDVLANLIAYAGTFQHSSVAVACPTIGDDVDGNIWGDVDCSGSINIVDVAAMLFYLLGLDWPAPLASGCHAVGDPLSACNSGDVQVLSGIRTGC